MPLGKKKVEKAHDGKVVDLDRWLGRPKNRIVAIGVEIEGGWEKVPAGAKIERDGSVFKSVDAGGLQREGFPRFKFGEIALEPMQPARLAAALKKHWPLIQDTSCGLHVHMSVANLYEYALLADSPDYQETVLDYFKRWAKEQDLKEDHPIWERLNGKSVYCQKKFWPMDQILQGKKDHDHNRHGHRYTMIHYCWGRNKTVECRLLPMMESVEQAVSAIRRLLDVTNAYLVVTAANKAKEIVELKFNRSDIYEEWIEVRL